MLLISHIGVHGFLKPYLFANAEGILPIAPDWRPALPGHDLNVFARDPDSFAIEATDLYSAIGFIHCAEDVFGPGESREDRKMNLDASAIPWGNSWIEWRSGEMYYGGFCRRGKEKLAPPLCVNDNMRPPDSEFDNSVYIQSAEMHRRSRSVIYFNRQQFMGYCRGDSTVHYTTAIAGLSPLIDENKPQETYVHPNDPSYYQQPVVIPDQIFAFWQVLACRNVSTDVKLFTVPKKQLKKGRDKKSWSIRYRTIKILQKKRKLSSNGERRSTPMALHTVRPHVKTFTKERPLFGKIVGRFLWSQQLRGDPEKGRVIKTYEA